jgi:hypothetical protein
VVLFELGGGLFFLLGVLVLHLLDDSFSLGIEFLENFSLFFDSGVSQFLSLGKSFVYFLKVDNFGDAGLESLLESFLDDGDLLWGGSRGVEGDAEGNGVGLFGLDLELHLNLFMFVW